MNRICIFVDGENFRHTIDNLYKEFIRKHRPEWKYLYLPEKADWAGFFDWLTEENLPNVAAPKRLRAYWYVTDAVDFSPYRIPNPHTKSRKFERMLKGNRSYREDRKEWDEYSSAELYQELTKRYAKFNKRFDGWKFLQDSISEKHRAIEFRRAGAIRYDLFRKEIGSEKAVDVKLATDMILLKDNYDVAIIVSGDQDFVPAVEAVKDAGKTVANVAFKTAKNKLLPGGARRLNQRADASIEVSHEILRGYLFPSHK